MGTKKCPNTWKQIDIVGVILSGASINLKRFFSNMKINNESRDIYFCSSLFKRLSRCISSSAVRWWGWKMKFARFKYLSYWYGFSFSPFNCRRTEPYPGKKLQNKLNLTGKIGYILFNTVIKRYMYSTRLWCVDVLHIIQIESFSLFSFLLFVKKIIW